MNARTKNWCVTDYTIGKTGKYGNLLAYFTLICLFFFVVSVALDEINKKGSGIEQIAIPNQYHFNQSIFSDFTNMVYDKWNYHLRTRINNYAKITPQPPIPTPPPILYNLGTTEQPKLNIEMEETETQTIYLSHNLPKIGSNYKSIESEKVESQILDYIKALKELEKANLTSQAKEMELKANEVIKTYLDAKGTNTPKEVNKLRDGIIKYLNGDGENPFKINRSTIGFKIPSKPSHTASVKTETKTVEKIVFKDGNMKACDHCSTQFLAAPKHKRFCCEQCRKDNWKEKNGRDPMMKRRK